MTAVDYAPVWAAAPADICRPGGLALTDHALALCDLPVNARALDVGCGPAVVCAHLRQRHGLAAFGLDPVPAALRGPARLLPLTQAVGETLPFASECLDLVLAECSLSLMPHPGRALREFRRVLRPAGWLALSDLYARAEHPGGPWTQAGLQAMLAGAGFRVVVWEDHTPALKVFAAHWTLTQAAPLPLGCGVRPSDRPGYCLVCARRS